MIDAAVRPLPLHERHAAAGARFAPFAGFHMPTRYTSIKDEHHAVRRRAGLFDVSHMGEVFVRGREALAAVQRLVSNDVSSLYDGRALYTVMCRPDGGIVDDLIIYRLAEDEVLICVNAANRAKDFGWIRDHLAGDAQAVDESDDWVQLAVQGPEAVGIVAAVVGEQAAEVVYYHAAWGELAGARCLVSRTGYTGEDGFELYVPADAATAVFDAVVAAGQSVKLQLAGLGARDTLRLEARYALYGNDIDETTNPIEAGLGWVVKLDAGDFIGREAVAQIKADGPRRRSRGLVLADRGVIRAGYDVYAGDVCVGKTTSGGIAPTLDDRSIGLAYIDIAHANDETVDVEIRGRRVPATTTKKPFYQRPKS